MAEDGELDNYNTSKHNDNDPNTRPLRKGDFVRVSELGIRKSKRLNDREKSLGRVMNICTNDDDTIIYEVEWILEGSRLQACEREDLRWTEGIGMVAGRAKRKPAEFMKEVEDLEKKKKRIKKPVVVEKKRKLPVAAKKETKRVALAEPEATAGSLDLYERHRRELERFFTRIKERVDVFHHFWDDAPPEFDETYDCDGIDPAEDGKVTTTPKATKYPTHAPYNWEMIRRRMEHGRYILDRRQKEEDERYKLFAPYYQSIGRRRGGRKKKAESDARVFNAKGVHWALFRSDVFQMCDAGLRRQDVHDDDDDDGQRGTVSYTVKKIKEAVQQTVDRTGKRHASEMDNADDRHKYSIAVQRGNHEAAMQSWRKEPFPERRYERLTADTVCDGLSTIDERIAQFERKTSLPDRFIGQAYQYDDTGESEAWMRSVVDETEANDKSSSKKRPASNKKKIKDSANDEVIRAQVSATMQGMLIAVQDKVMTDNQVMHQPELHSENWLREAKTEHVVESDIIEQPVWGIDCYTRKNLLHCLEIEFDAATALRFVEKWLLTAVNACPNEFAHDIGNAARILMDLPLDDGNDIDWTQTALGKALKRKIIASGPVWLKPCAHELLRARNALGLDFFRVHPKGHGSVVLANTIPSNSLVTFYRGELYPSWRWGEKMDAIEITQKRKHLKPALPDFYNMILERPHLDPRGYGILFVDASRKGGHGSSLSHSCDPTCEVRVASRNGELCLAMTTLRELEMGEELTFDYNAVTESLNEYRSAVCLCGYGKCRGSFLHFATADCYQQVLNRNSPIAARFANLVRGSMKQVMSIDDTKTLKRHGFSTAAFGAISVNRRKVDGDGACTLADSLDVVPVWLRTYVAETLRYIEYERRALPIALICENLAGPDTKDSADDDLSKEPQSETPFLYFARTQKELLSRALTEQGFPESMNRFKRVHAMKKVASAYWAGVSEEKKTYWKEEAKKDYVKRVKAWRTGQKQSTKKQVMGTAAIGTDELLRTSKISFKDADGESVAAMEQRIQQLTQSLSRVGRVLDRHRETMHSKHKLSGDGTDVLRNAVHAPLRFLSDLEVIDWMWNKPDGLIKSLLRSLEKCDIVRPTLIQSLFEIRVSYEHLMKCDNPVESQDTSNNICSSRHQLKRALLAFRAEIMKELKEMSKDYKNIVNEQKSSRSISRSSSVPASEDEAENMEVPCAETTELRLPVHLKDSIAQTPQWISQYGRRFVLRAAADILLMYANTSTFFVLQPYSPLESTPVNVYARELGNSVSRTVIDKDLELSDGVKSEGEFLTEARSECNPEDIVSSVSVRYQGEYVVSQLLQWYNAGIGLPPGLPDLLGCAILPRVADCFNSELAKEAKAKSDRKTSYESKVVPALVSWLQDPLQRGNPWPVLIQKAFNGPELQSILENPGERFLPLGSPIIDFLVTGNESNITAIRKELDASDKIGPGESDRAMLASVDKGRPAQAVSTWIQCENPKCQKWRKVPWHVDRDTLPEKFECKDNKWNPGAQSCDSPEDDWDASDALVGDDGKVEGTPIKKQPDENLDVQDEKSFTIGARFDVLRDGHDSHSVAKVTKVDFSGTLKRIMFHFVNTSPDLDEWIPFGSRRISPLNSTRPKAKKNILKGPQKARDIIIGDPKELSSIVVGARFDVLRKEKNRFFKAVVKEIDTSSIPMKILFHFLKTSSNVDEWVEFGSDRIRLYKSAVAPTLPKKKSQLENKKVDRQANPSIAADDSISKPFDETKQKLDSEPQTAADQQLVAGKSKSPTIQFPVVVEKSSPNCIPVATASNATVTNPEQNKSVSSFPLKDTPALAKELQETSSMQTEFVRSKGHLSSSEASLNVEPKVPVPIPNYTSSGNSGVSAFTGQPIGSVSGRLQNLHNGPNPTNFAPKSMNPVHYYQPVFQPNTPVEKRQPSPAAPYYHEQGFQSFHAGPHGMVHNFNGMPTGMPPPVVCRHLNGSNASGPSLNQERPNARHNCASGPNNSQERPNDVQRPPLSGLDVLAMLTERLEVAAEQQPNLSPEQALQQYVRTQMQFHR